jgi:hypothetical protein
MIGAGDRIKLIDFGIASKGSDIYAAGVMLYEMLTGTTQFRGPNPLAVMNARLTSDPRPPREITPEISPVVEEILLHALERDPRRRYATAQEFAHDLEHPGAVPLTGRNEPRREPTAKGVLFYSGLAMIPASTSRCRCLWPRSSRAAVEVFGPLNLHQCGAQWYHGHMASRTKARTRRASSIRQSVTIPAQLAAEVQRVAKEKHLTKSRALVALAVRGVEAEAAARESLNSAYRRFMSEANPQRKGEAGKDLIRAIFGKDAIAEDSIL